MAGTVQIGGKYYGYVIGITDKSARSQKISGACEPVAFLKHAHPTKVPIMVQTGPKKRISGSLPFALALMCLELLIVLEGVLLVASLRCHDL